jgi:hypothetical protein
MLLLKRTGVIVAVGAIVLAAASPAGAYTFTRTLQAGDKGPDVRVLQVRVAGWFPQNGQTQMTIDGRFGESTAAAVRKFQEFYGLDPDGVAGPSTFAVIDGLEDDDRSTIHFDWSEFKQNRNSNCSAKANGYAGTFGGGMVAPRRTKKNVKRMMWRLEALRAKAGSNTVAINSGFRSVAYNDCIGGARASQHMYGTAADNRMAEVTNRLERDLARATQFHGIGCYSSLSHNHFDLRMENAALDGARFWWWPDQDDQGRDLADDGKPCWGEEAAKPPRTDEGGDARSAFVPSVSFLGSFAETPEWYEGRAD